MEREAAQEGQGANLGFVIEAKSHVKVPQEEEVYKLIQTPCFSL